MRFVSLWTYVFLAMIYKFSPDVHTLASNKFVVSAAYSRRHSNKLIHVYLVMHGILCYVDLYIVHVTQSRLSTSRVCMDVYFC